MLPIDKPRLTPPRPADHKYTRGLVTVIGGAMSGAAALAALGAAHGGAGYVRLLAPERVAGLPHAVVQARYASAADVASALADDRIGAVVVGPGLGTDAAARAVVAAAIGSDCSLVIDADALAPSDTRFTAPTILTPHAGEFARMAGGAPGDPSEAAARMARHRGAVVLLKGSTTIVAAPDGRIARSGILPATLATAGTGDVLAGLCGVMLAQLRDPFDAARAAVWLHGEAARSIRGPFVADALAGALGAAVAGCW